MTGVAGSSLTRLVPYAAFSAAVCLLGVVVCHRLSFAAFYGAAFAGLAAAIALPLIAWGTPRGTALLLGAFVGGFFARMILVAVGLLASHARDQAALHYAFSFFAVYALTQAAEVLYVFNASRAPALDAPASGLRPSGAKPPPPLDAPASGLRPSGAKPPPPYGAS